MKKLLSLLMISVFALSTFSACSQSTAKMQKRSNEALQKSDEPTLYTSETLIDSSIVDSCKKISVYNYSNVEISDEEAILTICDALKNGKYEEAPVEELSKGAIKIQFHGDSEIKKLYLLDNLVFVDGKVYKDGSKSLINAVKAYSDKYIMDSCILDSCDKIVISGYGYTSIITAKSEISEICDSIKNTEFTFFDLGYGIGRDGGIYVEFFHNDFSQGFQPDEEVYVNRVGFKASSTEFWDIIKKYDEKYREKQ